MVKVKPTGVEAFFREDEIIVSKTDTKGHITYGNEVFLKLAKYSEEELLGAPHSIIRHPDMPRTVFKYLWDTIQNKHEVNAYVINLAKDGSHYWVLANVTPSFDQNGKIIGYYSVRRIPSKEALSTVIIPLYQELLKVEATSGLEGGMQYLTDALEKTGKSYEEFIFKLEYGEQKKEKEA